MHKRTKLAKFNEEIINEAFQRDNGCMFCNIRYHMKCRDDFMYAILDPMHIVGKSQGGLGLVTNCLCGCRYHHGLHDNGNKGLRVEMDHLIDEYMIKMYPNWKRIDQIFKKY